MPHVHLPAIHTDADLVLAANVAAIVGSEDLYVSWTHDSGPGAVPEVAAVVREHRTVPPLATLLHAIATGMSAMWNAFTQPAPAVRPAQPAPAPAREAS
jgi:hypothetical protein